MTNVLVVEDDPRVADFLRRGLAAEGYKVDIARDGPSAIARVHGPPAHRLVILDRRLPGGFDGSAVCAALRAEGWDGAVLMLTARDTVRERVEGLNAGADDYLTKPFAFDELLARLQALARRVTPRADAADGKYGALRVGTLTLDPRTRRATRDGRALELTAREFDLLRYLMEHPGEVISRQRLLSAVWNYSFDPTTKVVDVYVRYLRQKIDPPGGPSLIRAVRSVGYGLEVGQSAAARPVG